MKRTTTSRTNLRTAILAPLVASSVALVTACGGGHPEAAPARVSSAPAAAAVAPAPADPTNGSAAVLTVPRSFAELGGVVLGDAAGDGAATVTEEPVFHRAGETSSYWRHMGDFLSYVHLKTGVLWGEAFVAAGYQAPAANARFPMPGERLRTACSNDGETALVTDDESAFYCSADDTIYISQKWAIDLYNGTLSGPLGQRLSPAVRDFAVAYVVAHEFGHAIQHEIGVRSSVIGLPAFEQQADCLAGVWAAKAAAWGMLDPGDLQEALATAWLLGDAGDDHGTGAQRQAAVALGLSQGIAGCASYSR